MSQNGDAGQLKWIRTALESYEGQLTRYARRITGDSERARDVVQETFLRLCRETPADLDGRLAQWLFKVCRNQALDIVRKESRMTTLTEPRQLAADVDPAGPHDEVEQKDQAKQILALVDQLPENQREAIRLRFQSGLSYAQIAAVTGWSKSNVGLLIHRGLTALRKRIKRDD